MAFMLIGFTFVILFWLLAFTAGDRAWRARKNSAWLPSLIALVILLLLAVTLAFLLVDWREWQRPGQLGRILIGGLVAMMVVAWLHRREFDDNAERAEMRSARPFPQRLDPRLEAKWAVPIAAMAILLAVILPHIDRIMDDVHRLKAGPLELQLAARQQGGTGRQELKHALEDHYLRFFASFNNDVLIFERLSSDERMASAVKDPEAAKQAVAALHAFRTAYTTLLKPFTACVMSAIDAGADITSLKSELGPFLERLVGAMQQANSPGLSHEIAGMEEQLEKLLKRRACAQIPAKKFDPSAFAVPALMDSEWIHIYIAHFFGFLDNPIQAARYLESLSKARKGQVQVLVALSIYWDALQQRRKAIDYADDLVILIERKLTSSCEALSDVANDKSIKVTWKDVERWEDSLANARNTYAYLVARGKAFSEPTGDLQVRQAYARIHQSIAWSKGQGAVCRHGGRFVNSIPKTGPAQDDFTDTLAYLVLAHQLATPSPDSAAIACALDRFKRVRDNHERRLEEASGQLAEPGGRFVFERALTGLLILDDHVRLAVSALGGRQEECSPHGEKYFDRPAGL